VQEYVKTNEKKLRAILKIDFENAFNLVNRNEIFKEVRDKLPQLAAWVEYCYGDTPYLYMQDTIMHSVVGVMQGDPLGPLLFCMVLQPILIKIKETVPELGLNASYLDDLIAGGTPEQLKEVVDIIQLEGPKRGLILNLKKTELFSLNLAENVEKYQDLPEEIIRNTGSGTKHLGGPVGSKEFCNELVVKRVKKIEYIMEKLVKLL